MYGLASHRVSILRATTTNNYGDVIDDDSATPVATGVLAALAVTNTTRHNPATQDIRTIRSISGAVQSDIDVRETDRLLDEGTGSIYVVESVTQPLGPGFAGNLELVLTRVN
jgi:hypothetical protein